MSIIAPLEARTPDDHDARFIGMAAALKAFMNYGVADNEKMRGYVEQLCPDDVGLAAKAMYVAQWLGGK
jgi:hypothetical protein